jgi:DNA-binding protein HU-beta
LKVEPYTFAPIFQSIKNLKMNKGDLISKVAESTSLTTAQAKEAVNSVLGNIEASLKDGDKVAVIGFGTFTVSERPARTGRNPKTGEAIQIAAKNVIKFKPGKELAASVN